MVSLTSKSRYQNPWKVNPLYMAEADSEERADVRADWMHVCIFALYLETVYKLRQSYQFTLFLSCIALHYYKYRNPMYRNGLIGCNHSSLVLQSREIR